MSIDASPAPARNWAGNLTYAARSVLSPTTIDQVQDIVAGSSALKALGSRHSFSDVADTTGDQLSVAFLPPSIVVDHDRREVAVSAGLRYGDVARALDGSGWALGNLASLPHISVAGAVATSTHGSGDGQQTLAGAVAGIALVDGGGHLVRLRRGDADFDAAVVSLGALGIVVEVTLDLVPAFEVRQDVFEGLGWDALADHFDEVTGAGYSVSVFTDWDATGARQVWVKSRTDEGEEPRELFGATPAEVELHPLPGVSPVNCTPQLGVPGPWSERLSHFRLDFTPSNGDEIQSEFLVPRSRALDAIEALRSLGPAITPLLQVGEIRTMAADRLWLSVASRDPGVDEGTVGFHFTWKPQGDAVAAILPELSARMAALEARPHWGKVFDAEAFDFAALYPRLGDFREVASRFDPRGVFRSAFLERTVYAD